MQVTDGCFLSLHYVISKATVKRRKNKAENHFHFLLFLHPLHTENCVVGEVNEDALQLFITRAKLVVIDGQGIIPLFLTLVIIVH